MATPAKRGLVLASLLAGLPLAQATETVTCHLTYGGEMRTVTGHPITTPYTVPPFAIGSYFRFRIVFRREPAELAGIKLYTYADRDNGLQLIHQANHAYPASNAPRHGFTGLNVVYEPVRDGELQYWCEMEAAG